MWTSKEIVQAVTISLLCSFALALPAQNSGILHCVMILTMYIITLSKNKFYRFFCVRYYY